MEQIDQPLGIGDITISPPENIPSYAQVRESYTQNGYKETSGISVKLQAEDSSWRNDSVVRRESNVDPNTEPYSLTSRMLNTVGVPLENRKPECGMGD